MTRKKILFTDWRDIQCGAIAWLTAEGDHYRVSTPPEPQVPMRAEPRLVPRGIRLQAQPARKAGKMERYGGWGRVIFDGEQYRTWYIEVNGVSILGSGSVAHTDTITSVAICGIKSRDGYHWGEPTRSEINVPGQRGFDGMTFFIDPHAP